MLATHRLVRTDINSAASVSGQPEWEDVIPQHSLDLMQWATALKVTQDSARASLQGANRPTGPVVMHGCPSSIMRCLPLSQASISKWDRLLVGGDGQLAYNAAKH